MRILVVEDEPRLAMTLVRGLRRHGMAVDVATDGHTALEKADTEAYDVVVLDRNLPGLHGDEVCRRLDADGHRARILMLTAATSPEELVAGFALGADDYLGKPFRFGELLARVTALGRRRAVLPAVLRHGELVLDPGRRTATRAGAPLPLTPREFEVLRLLMVSAGQVVSAESLFAGAWDERTDPFTASVRVIVSRLRAKLGEPPLIETVVGSGYRL